MRKQVRAPSGGVQRGAGVGALTTSCCVRWSCSLFRDNHALVVRALATIDDTAIWAARLTEINIQFTVFPRNPDVLSVVHWCVAPMRTRAIRVGRGVETPVLVQARVWSVEGFTLDAHGGYLASTTCCVSLQSARGMLPRRDHGARGATTLNGQHHPAREIG